MNGNESRALMEAWAMDLLDEAEELAIGEHVESCTPCKTEWDALSGVFVELTDMVDEDTAKDAIAEAAADALRTQVLAAAATAVSESEPAGEKKADKAKPSAPPAAPTADAEALGIKVKLNCSYCHAPTSREEVTFCATCLAPHHRECFRAHGRCSTLACEETRTVRPAQPDLGGEPPRLEVKRGGGGKGYALAFVALAALGGAAAVALNPGPTDAELYTAAKEEILERKAQTLLKDLRAAAADGNRFRVSGAFGKIEALCEATVEAEPTLKDVAYRILGEAESLRAQVMPGNKLFNLDVEDAALDVVLETISGYAGRRILVSPEVDETITVTLTQVSWQDALELVSQLAGCRVEERPGGALLLTQPPEVTIQFTDANVRTVIQMLASYSKRNIVISPSVRGSVTLDLKEARWDEALLSIVHTVGDFSVVLQGHDIIKVVTRSSVDPLIGSAYGYPLTPDKYKRFEDEHTLKVNVWKPRRGQNPRPQAFDDAEPQEPKRVSLQFQDADLRKVVAELSKQAGVSVGVDTHVEETISVSLKDVAWDHALRAVASSAGCRVQERSKSGRVLALVQIPKVTIQFTDANVRTVLQLLAAYSGKNIVISPEVRGTCTLRVVEADWDAALKAIVEGVGDYGLWSVGDQILARSRSSSDMGPFELASEGKPFELASYWSLLPPDAQRVRLRGEHTLAEHCAEFTRQTGTAVRIEGLLPTTKRELKGRRTSGWRDQVKALADTFGCSIEETPDGLVIRGREANTLRTAHANLRTWIELLAERSHRNVVIAPDVRGTVTLELQDASYEGALSSVVRSYGCTTRDVNGILVVGRDATATPTRRQPKSQTRTNLKIPAPQLTGLAISSRARHAILADRIYQVGDALIDETTDEEFPGPVIVTEMTRNGVAFQVEGEISWVVLERGEDGEIQSAPLRPKAPDVADTERNRPHALASRLVDGDASALASNAALSGQLQAIGAKSALGPLVRLVRNRGFRGRGTAAVALAQIVAQSEVGEQTRAWVLDAIGSMHARPNEPQHALKREALSILSLQIKTDPGAPKTRDEPR